MLSRKAPSSTASNDLPFRRFVSQTAARQVLFGNKPTKLGARAFDVLMALIKRRDSVVSKNELLDAVWPSLIVEENDLQVHFSVLRKLLGPQTIITIPSRGYRFFRTATRDFGCHGSSTERRPAARVPWHSTGPFAAAVESRHRDLTTCHGLVVASADHHYWLRRCG